LAAAEKNKQKNAKVAKKSPLCGLRDLLFKAIQNRQFPADMLGRRACISPGIVRGEEKS
jgi:hypothetical protein